MSQRHYVLPVAFAAAMLFTVHGWSCEPGTPSHAFASQHASIVPRPVNTPYFSAASNPIAEATPVSPSLPSPTRFTHGVAYSPSTSAVVSPYAAPAVVQSVGPSTSAPVTVGRPQVMVAPRTYTVPQPYYSTYRPIAPTTVANPYTANPYTANPYTANPYTANPYTANPYTANPYTANRPANSVYYGKGLIGQPKLYVDGQPVRNLLRYLSP